MNTIANIAINSSSALLLFLAVYFVLNRMLKNQERSRNTDLLSKTRQITVPLRLQAYERLILFLERIAPDAMVVRLKNNAPTNADLQLFLLKTIRTEFEHNLSQQLYISSSTWEVIKQAKEDTAKLINDVAKTLNPNESSIMLSKAIFDKLIEEGTLPTTKAIEELKKEARKLF